jgi:hypothetical protein
MEHATRPTFAFAVPQARVSHDRVHHSYRTRLPHA